MIIKLSPQRRDDKLSVIKNGETLTINGKEYDFSPLEDGATLPHEAVNCPYICKDIHRVDGELYIELLLPLGKEASQEAKFPSDIVDPPDGKIELPYCGVQK